MLRSASGQVETDDLARAWRFHPPAGTIVHGTARFVAYRPYDRRLCVGPPPGQTDTTVQVLEIDISDAGEIDFSRERAGNLLWIEGTVATESTWDKIVLKASPVFLRSLPHPVVLAVESIADQTVTQGRVAELQVTFEDAGLSSPHQAQIEWGDGVITVGTVVEQAADTFARPGRIKGTVSATHRYAHKGAYMASVLITNRGGDHGGAGSRISVVSAPLVVTAERKLISAQSGTRVLVRASVWLPEDSGRCTAAIDWGDGGQVQPATVRASCSAPADGSAGSNPAGSVAALHEYSEPGSYRVRITVTDPAGISYWDSVAVEVTAAASRGSDGVDNFAAIGRSAKDGKKPLAKPEGSEKYYVVGVFQKGKLLWGDVISGTLDEVRSESRKQIKELKSQRASSNRRISASHPDWVTKIVAKKTEDAARDELQKWRRK